MDQFRDYNVILLEVSPSLSVLSSACYLAADLIAMPCTPDAYSLESLPLTIQSIREIGDTFDRPIPQDRFRIIYNNTREHQTTQDGLKFLLENYEDMLYPVYIKHSIEVVKCNNAGYPVASSRPSEVRNQFRQIACLIGELPLTGAQRGQA
jgi:cellulose biosynthesis protein BcsQ